MAGALEGIRVLDFSQYFAGPACTMTLRTLGAEVIKVERPGRGDGQRAIPPFVKGLEANIFISLNRGKKSITLNLKSERARQIIKRLVAKVDVLVENYTPGVMDRLSLSYEELRRVNPRLIYASVSGFGHTGPQSSEPSFDMIGQATGGFTTVTGFPGNPPTKAGPAIADFLASYNLTVGILAALLYRSETGEGQMIDISMQDSVWAVTAVEFAPWYFLTGKVPPRFGNGMAQLIPFNIYPAKDGYVVINVIAMEQWENLLRVMGKEDWIGLQKYSVRERINYRDEVDALVENWTKTRSVEEILRELKDAHLPCSLVPSFEQVVNDPQLLSREMIVEIEQPISGKVKVPGSPLKLSKTPVDVKFPAPSLGEHNCEVYSTVLGYSEQEIKKLADDGITG